MVSMRRAAPRVLLLLCSVALWTACPEDKVTVPQSDATPPTVALDVSGFGPLISLTASSGPEERRGGASQVGLIATGNDGDGGVRRVAIIHSFRRSCVDAAGVASQPQTLTSPVAKTQAGQVGSQVAPKLVVQHSIAVADFNQCPPETQLSRLEIVARAEAENFSGGRAQTANFTFLLVKP